VALTFCTAVPALSTTPADCAEGRAVQKVSATVALVTGAVAYAWYLGTGAGALYLQQITTINSVAFTTALVTTTQNLVTLAAVDYSKVGAFGFDGLLYQAPFAAGSGAYFASLATGVSGVGTQMTTDNSGGIVEINTMLKDRYDNYRLSPDTLWCNSQEVLSIKNLVIKNGGAPLVRMVGDYKDGLQGVVAGTVVGFYMNPVTMKTMKVRVHPFQTAGTILATSREAPYAGSRVAVLSEMLCRQEYYSTLWPQRSRKREYGVYVDETLLNYFPPAFGAITNIAPTLF
jgi:hypothetical protein